MRLKASHRVTIAAVLVGHVEKFGKTIPRNLHCHKRTGSRPTFCRVTAQQIGDRPSQGQCPPPAPVSDFRNFRRGGVCMTLQPRLASVPMQLCTAIKNLTHTLEHTGSRQWMQKQELKCSENLTSGPAIIVNSPPFLASSLPPGLRIVSTRARLCSCDWSLFFRAPLDHL